MIKKIIKHFSIILILSIVFLNIIAVIKPVSADSLKIIPVVDTFITKNYKDELDGKTIDITIPHINDVNTEINKEISDNASKLIKKFISADTQYLSLYSNYTVFLETDSYLSFQIVSFEATGSSNTTYKNYTIDKNTGNSIVLNDLFIKESNYLEILTNEVIQQLKQRGIPYFDEFNTIKSDHDFYINQDNKLVLTFNKYDIAPGSYGTPQFIIPTQSIQHILISNSLIN